MFTVCIALFASISSPRPYDLQCWVVTQDEAERAVVQCVETRPVTRACKATKTESGGIVLEVSALPGGA